MKTKQKILRNRPIGRLDWVVFTAVAVFCFFVFQHADILHTGASSFAYLNGHILDFYDHNVQFVSVNNYLPSTYILFAIWNIPVYLLGLVSTPTLNVPEAVLFWYKLLPTLFYLGSGYLVYKILTQLEVSVSSAKIGTFIFLSAPIGFFSVFLFGQYDSFTLFFMLLGIYYWIKDRINFFILFFGIAITFKYTALLIFFPLLLLREKRYLRIILSIILVAIPFAAEVLVYLPSEAFRNGVFGFGAVGYVSNLHFQSTNFLIAPVVVLWILICGFAFYKNCESKEQLYKWGLFCSSLVCFLLFGLCQWHPQWLLFMMPFLSMGMLYHKKGDSLLLIDLVLMMLFVLIVSTAFLNNADQQLLYLGAFRDHISQKGGFSLTMNELLHAPEIIYSFSAFSGVLLVATLVKHPKLLQDQVSDQITKWGALIRLRFVGGISVFVIPALICLVVTLNGPVLPQVSATVSEDCSSMSITLAADQDYWSNCELAVWSNINGQDDLAWYTLAEGEPGKWTYTVDLSDHMSTGPYNVHIYGTHEGEQEMMTSTVVEVSSLPANVED